LRDSASADLLGLFQQRAWDLHRNLTSAFHVALYYTVCYTSFEYGIRRPCAGSDDSPPRVLEFSCWVSEDGTTMLSGFRNAATILWISTAG
jgi:hypothetical protein